MHKMNQKIKKNSIKPLRPKTILKLVKLWPHARKQGHYIGELRRVGYYSRQDGLDFVSLVDKHGNYNWTADHEFISKFFKVVKHSQERSYYGKNRPELGKLKYPES